MASSINQKRINNFYPHSVTGKADDSFVGIKIVGNSIHFYYPETYHFNLNSSHARNDIIDLLHTISIAKTMPAHNLQANTKNLESSEFALLSNLWIIRDFLANGFYVFKEKFYKINQSGRVDWKKTMQLTPIVSNGNIIYPNIVATVKNNADNILTQIHRLCIKKSLDFIGWIFNLSSNFIEQKPFNPIIKKKYIATLKKELNNTFNDDKRLRLTHMLNVIQGLDSEQDHKEFLYGVDTYHYIFEKMIDSIFGTIKNLKHFKPKAKWQLVKNDFKQTNSSDLRPDTILIKDCDAFILDSKFYRFGHTKNEQDLPETTSIQKQITYGDYLKKNAKKMQINNIYNAFIIPYDSEADSTEQNERLKYVGFARAMWRNNTLEHEFVHTFLIDLKYVVKTWNRYNHKADIDDLVAQILTHQKNAIDRLDL